MNDKKIFEIICKLLFNLAIVLKYIVDFYENVKNLFFNYYMIDMKKIRKTVSHEYVIK